MSDREVLFTVTAADCDWDFMRSRGPGGQNVNKRETKVRCTHRASGAVGESEESRSQKENKSKAFVKMANTPKFKAWHKLECAKRMGKLADIDEAVERELRRNVKTEGRVDGKWVPIEQAPWSDE